MLLVLENYILPISKVVALCNDYTLIAEKVKKNPTIIRWTIPIKAFILKQISNVRDTLILKQKEYWCTL
jgi:hypothetical protein